MQHLFHRTIDATSVLFVRPSDTERPTWVAYQQHEYLGTLHAQPDVDEKWHLQGTRERHQRLDDAIRALRRPPSWARDCELARRWARTLLDDPQLLILDIQTTDLHDARAVQIGVIDRAERIIVNELINPQAPIAPAATALHGITQSKVASAPTFAELQPRLKQALQGRRCLAYNLDFDKDVIERELRRVGAPPTHQWLARTRWEDAMHPYATWKGLWATHRRGYRFQRLNGSYDAVKNCQAALQTVRRVAGY
ncbi:exonuclease domain-containing protein [Streptomyces lydicamycinicus]|uniref:3'-5' exonuclease n=1 Tax=Streptomyces lydicamycinicus TaxID=1546107 RepID=UPI003C30E420